MPGSSTATMPARRPRRQQTTLLEADWFALTPSMLTGVAVVIQRISAVNRRRMVDRILPISTRGENRAPHFACVYRICICSLCGTFAAPMCSAVEPISTCRSTPSWRKHAPALHHAFALPWRPASGSPIQPRTHNRLEAEGGVRRPGVDGLAFNSSGRAASGTRHGIAARLQSPFHGRVLGGSRCHGYCDTGARQ